MCTHTQPHANAVTLDNISHTDDFRAGKITEHICRSSIIIMNWTVANFHYRLSFRSICSPLPLIPRHFLHLTHGVIYTFMTLEHEPVYREGLLPCLQSESLQISLLSGHFGCTSSVGFSSTAGAGEVSYPNNSEGQSPEQREKGVYRVSAHSKLEDYLWICSRTGGAGGDRRLAREIKGVPAVQRQAVLELGNDDNWNLKEEEGEHRYSEKDKKKKIPGRQGEGGQSGKREGGIEREREERYCRSVGAKLRLRESMKKRYEGEQIRQIQAMK